MRLLLLCFLFGLCAANIIVSEIMYNPRQGNDFQFVELYNTDSNSVDLSNWVFTSANTAFTFPSSTSIGGNAFVILAKDKNSFMFAYPDVPSNIVYGNIASIATGSGRINLKKSDGSVVLDYKYKDSWQPLSDGYGPSLELICYAVTDYTDANAWRASTLPTYGDILQEYSGSPNAHGTWYTCPPPVNSYPNINLKFSELMYHPNQEKSQVDNHEWLEIYNADSAALSLDGFRIVGKKGLMFSFPAGTVISANSYLVVAKNPSAFSAIYTSVPSSQVFGPYYGELANGGDSIAIADNNGRVIEEISYDNKWPWPLAADVQVNQPQYGGLSIERVSWSYSGNKAHNWVAATPTPGAANSAARAVPRPVVMTITVRQNGVDQGGNLAPSVNTNITFEINPKGSYENPTLEYFVDDIHTTGEQTNSVSLSEDSNGTYFYNFANGFAAKTILRFRVKADFDGSTGQVISHRSNDPVGWHGIYFSLQEVYDTNSTTYEIMITSSEWTAMWTNMRTDTNGHQYLDEESGKCCQPNPVWNADSVAVLAYRGKVYDVSVKYQGSNFNRMNGDNLDAFQSDENPTLPSPVIQLSWKIKLADYDSKIDGKEDIIIQKPKNLGCSYFTGYGLYKLARQLGLPAPKIKFSKLYVNGAYYLYGMDVDYYSSDMLQAFIEDHNRKNCRTQPTMQPGFAYKAMGYGCTQGYDGLADFQILKESTECGETIPADTRYANAYSLETEKSYGNTTRIQQLAFKIGKYNYDGQGNLISLDFTEPVKPEVKQYMQDNFDVNLVLNYLVLVNWAGAYDDLVGNYMLYVRQDGKMSMTAWDMDALMGANSPCEQASCSLFLGEQGAPVSQYNPPGGYNNLKDALIKTFREELKERYRVLAQTVLSVENVNKVFQEAQNEIDTSAMADPNVFPGVKLENMQSICYKNITTWHAQRNSYVKDTLGSPQSTTVNTCPDVAPLTQRFVTTYRAAPGTPDSPTLVKNSESSATVNWSAPNSNGYEITSYTLQKSVDDGDFNTVYSGSAQTYEDKEFSTKKLQYRVQATNSLGTSPYSAATTVVGGVITPVTTGTIGNSGALSTAGSENENSGSILCVSLLVYLLATFVAF